MWNVDEDWYPFQLPRSVGKYESRLRDIWIIRKDENAVKLRWGIFYAQQGSPGRPYALPILTSITIVQLCYHKTDLSESRSFCYMWFLSGLNLNLKDKLILVRVTPSRLHSPQRNRKCPSGHLQPSYCSGTPVCWAACKVVTPPKTSPHAFCTAGLARKRCNDIACWFQTKSIIRSC